MKLTAKMHSFPTRRHRSDLSGTRTQLLLSTRVQDKKEMIASMAEAGEIDQPLIDLLTQNITAAEAAGQKEAAEFMTKVRNAANRFLIATPDADALKAQFEKDREVRRREGRPWRRLCW